MLTDRLLLDIQYAHIGNNFTLTFQEPAQRDVQPRFDIASGSWARSYNESIFVRPTQSIDVTTSYFLPATLGGDHAFKVGYRWRTARGRVGQPHRRQRRGAVLELDDDLRRARRRLQR